MNEVKIQIPDNCELIKDGDTYIVKEKKQEPPRSWEEFCDRYQRSNQEYFINDDSEIEQVINSIYPRDCGKDKNICCSKEEAEAFLALMQLRQLRKAWVGDWKSSESKYAIICVKNEMLCADEGEWCYNYRLTFPIKAMAEDFLDCFRALCETAKILL